MQEIAANPVIRAKVREIVRVLATVSTEPTDVGAQTLDPFHKHGCVKRIRDKPALRLILDDKEQYLHMVAAEKEGLIKVRCLGRVGSHAYTILLTRQSDGVARCISTVSAHLLTLL
jgi:hypothetical protein